MKNPKTLQTRYMKYLPFSLIQLQYFVVTAELSSMTLAAYDLHVSQSTISSAIKQLEKDLGLQLFERHYPKGISLSGPGMNFYHELKEFLVHANEIAEKTRYLSDILTGELLLGCFSVLSPFYLPCLLNKFEKACPQVNVIITEGHIEGLVEKLRNGSIELAITYNINLPHDIQYEVLSQVKPYVLVSAHHRLAERGQEKVSLRELAQESCIFLDLPHSRDYFIDLFKYVGCYPNITYKSSNFETVRAFVAQGRGYAILNQRSHISTTYHGGETVILDVEESTPPLELVLAKLKSIKPSQKAEKFREICHTSFPLGA